MWWLDGQSLWLPPWWCYLLATSLFISTSPEDKQGGIKGEEAQTSQFLSLLAVLVKTWWEKNCYQLKWDTRLSVGFSMFFLPLIIRYSQASLTQSTSEWKYNVQILGFPQQWYLLPSITVLKKMTRSRAKSDHSCKEKRSHLQSWLFPPLQLSMTECLHLYLIRKTRKLKFTRHLLHARMPDPQLLIFQALPCLILKILGKKLLSWFYR